MQEKIRVLYLITEYSVGGAEKAMVRIISRLNRSKYNITVAALRMGSGRLLSELEAIKVRIEILGTRGKYDFVFPTFRLYRLLNNLNIQILICSLYHPTILGRIIGKLAGVSVIINWEHSEVFGGAFRKILNKITMFLSDKVVCDSEKVSIEFKRHFHPDNSLIEIIPIGGVDLSQYFCDRSGVHDDIRIGSVGRLIESKGYPYLIDTARMILKARDNVFFCIIGDGPGFNYLQGLIEKAGISERTKLTGFRSDIPDILSTWDIYVQPSLWEGLCLTVVEAIASGLPVVATNVGGIPESVIDGYNGFLVPPKDPRAFADRILELVDNPDLRIRMGERSRKIAEEKYSLESMVNKVEELIDTLIKEKIVLVSNYSRNV